MTWILEREALYPFVDQRAGEHTAQASLAFLYVYQKVPVSGRDPIRRSKNPPSCRRVRWPGRVGWSSGLVLGRTIASARTHDDDQGSRDFQEFSASDSRVSSLLTAHRLIFSHLALILYFLTPPARTR